MKQFFQKNRRLRKRLTKTKERIVEAIQLFNAATLQQMSEEKKEKKNEKMISVDEKSTENVKMKKIMKKKVFEKERESRYNDVRDRRREKLECNDFHEVSHR